MKVIPAIDIRDGRCVRLLRGERGTEKIYGLDPVEMAAAWEDEGAEWLHVVDLDGAFGVSSENRSAIERIVARACIPVQVGGGVRSFSDWSGLVEAGAARIVFGTAAVERPLLVREALERAPERVVVGVDVRAGKIAVRGWDRESRETQVDLGRRWVEAGVSVFVYTDIQRDGSLEGPNVEAVRAFCRGTGARVIASGGVGSLDDLRRLRVVEGEGVEAIIVGKALYERRFTLREAIDCLSGSSPGPEEERE